MKKYLLSIFLVIFSVFAGAKNVVAKEYFVSNTGSDTAVGTVAAPFKSFAKAVSALSSGDTLYIYGGTYTEKLSVSNIYSALLPITIKPVLNQTVVIYANGKDAPVSIFGSYINLEGLEIKGSLPAVGNTILDCVLIKGKNININKFKVHECYHFGIRLGGQNIVVENSEVFDNETENINGKNTTGGWGSGIKGSSGASGNIIRNNHIYHNWGEGIAMTMSGSASIINNLVYDNYSVNIYIDNSFDIDVLKNMTYSTNPAYFRSGNPANCITMGEENYTGWGYQLKNIKIMNNIMYHCKNGTGYTYSEGQNGGMDSVTIANNTIWGSTASDLRIINQPYKTGNSLIANNIIGNKVNVEVTNGIIYKNNFWTSVTPIFAVGVGDKIGDPKFIGIPDSNPNTYALNSSSVAINSGTVISSITDDYFSKARDIYPDIGAIEYIGTIDSNPFPILDTIVPVVIITSPKTGATVTRSRTTTITTTATDNVGITKLEYYVNNVRKCSSTTVKSCAWSVPSSTGVTYTILVKAYDKAGNAGTATSVVKSVR